MVKTFFVIARRNSAKPKPVDAADNMAVVRNMNLYAFALGNDGDAALVCPARNKAD